MKKHWRKHSSRRLSRLTKRYYETEDREILQHKITGMSVYSHMKHAYKRMPKHRKLLLEWS